MTCYSMTGYARQECLLPSGGSLVMEMRSLNHRFFQVSFSMPSLFYPFEEAWKKRIQERLHRGKVQVQIQWITLPPTMPVLHEALLTSAAETWKKLFPQEPLPASLLLLPEVTQPSGVSLKDEDCHALAEGLEKTLDQLVESREREGKILRDAMLSYVDSVEEQFKEIKAKMPALREDLLEHFRINLETLLKEVPVDENRLLMEAALLVQKVDVEEELVRIQAHLKGIKKILLSEDPLKGKAIRFYLQELQRECNTYVRKIRDMSLKEKGLTCQTYIEACLEQVQNLL